MGHRYVVVPQLLTYMASRRRIIQTGDGSPSIFSNEFGELYHSRHGAVQESKHVFIEAALRHKAVRASRLSILEMGLGTGLNAFMTLLDAVQHHLPVQYVAIEAFPISPASALQLDYPTYLSAEAQAAEYAQIHEGPWGVAYSIHPHFSFEKQLMRFEKVRYHELFDIIYFDAFSPNKQPMLWSEQMFQNMYQALRSGGVLCTYCAKGIVKRRLRAVGFAVHSLPGPPGKREMVRALKSDG